MSAPMPKIKRCTKMLISEGRLRQSQQALWYSSRSTDSNWSAACASSAGLESGILRRTQELKVWSLIARCGGDVPWLTRTILRRNLDDCDNYFLFDREQPEFLPEKWIN